MLTVDGEWARKFYENQFPITRGCLRRYRLQEADIENLLQDAMVITLEKATSETNEIGAYFHRITINLANKQLAKKNYSPGEEAFDNNDQPDEVLEQIETESCVIKVWNKFKNKHPRHAEVIELIDDEKWNGKQIAAYLGKKEDTARQYGYQARKYYLAILYDYCKIHFSDRFWKKRGFNGQ